MYKVEIFSDQFIYKSMAFVDETTTAIEQDFLTYDSNTIQTPLIDCEKGDLIHITDQDNNYVADGIIADVQPGNKAQEITIRPLNALFDTEVFYTAVTDCITWLATNIDNAFMSNTDTLQNRPITLTYTQSADNLPLTGFNLHETINILSVMVSAMKTYGVVVASRLDLPNKRFTVNIYQQTATKTLEASLKNVLQKSVTIGDSYGSTNKAIIRKIRVVDDVTTVLGQTEFYLHTDGTINSTDGNRIVPVFWELESLEIDDDETESEWQAAALSRAKEILTPAKYDNEIVLQYDRDDLLARPADLLIGTATTIYLDGNTYASILTGKRIEGQKITLIFGVTRTELTKQLSIKQRETLTYQNTVSAINKIVEKRIAGGGGSVEPTTTTPLMDGTAQVGTEQKYARGDHRHPTDTSRVGFADMTINNISWSDKWRIPAGTDFNDLKTIGVWFNNYDAEVRQMPNAPLGANASAGTLEIIAPLENLAVGTVISGNWRYITQKWTTWRGEEYIRSLSTNGSGAWTYGNWMPIANVSMSGTCTGDSTITFTLNQAHLTSNIGFIALNFKSSTQKSGFSASGITIPSNMRPTASRNIFTACSIGSNVQIAQWQVLDTGVIRCGATIPANTQVNVSIMYPVK